MDSALGERLAQEQAQEVEAGAEVAGEGAATIASPSSAESGVERGDLLCTHPGFLKRYFETSRLHHLSTWKADLVDCVIAKLGPRHRASLPQEPLRTLLHVDMDCFFASVGVRDRPRLRDRPVAVAHSQGGLKLDFSTSEIASCNYPARARGVKNGMFLGAAKGLCADLEVIPYEFDKYDKCSR
ncbi:hypothetical protein B484DRAFT_406920 [Ochromonadaceae sp. CCMP2298]|nr:hypothetical protein B484DRAFT_406920 [Ochromonadaceae sp. CCMP2298]